MTALVNEVEAQPVGEYETHLVPPGVDTSGFTVPVHITLWDDCTVTAYAQGYYSDVCDNAEAAIADIIDQMNVERIQEGYLRCM